MIDTSALPVIDLSTLQPPMNVTLVTPESGLDKLSSFVAKKLDNGIAGLDTETNVCSDFFYRYCRTLQIGDKDEQYVIDLLAFAGSEEKLRASQGHFRLDPVYKPIFDILTPALCSNKVLKVGQSLSFDYTVLYWNFGQRIWNLYSTDLAERVLQAGAISLKRMAEFSMEQIVARIFKKRVDKAEQEGFDLCTPLTPQQIQYAAFDVRMPLSIREFQLRRLTAEQLITTAQIENEALPAYQDMHLYGLALDCPRWLKRLDGVVERRKGELEILDQEFLGIVGHKHKQIDLWEMAHLEKKWRENFEAASPTEMEKAAQLRETRDKELKEVYRAELKSLEKERKAKKALARSAYTEKSKEFTDWKKKVEDMEGEAYVNYNSPDQLLAALKKVPGLGTLQSVADDYLLDYNDRPFIQTLRKYRKGKKDTGTYGVQWTQTWTTKALTVEGWRHPWDGRIRAKWNQLEAETGRSSSQMPSVMNLPKDDEVRACFICDPPDENIRISTCCNELAAWAGRDYDPTTGAPNGKIYGKCDKCGQTVPTVPEEYVIVTVDMSGAELRIIAELANATSWIQAFAKGHDVHSVSTEILEPEKWKAGALSDCAYYALDEHGEPKRKKCKCPVHVHLRDHTKAVNFLLCYGGGPDALADELGITVDAAKELMKLHEKRFPDVWGYLKRSGECAQEQREARDLYGRRRLLPEPTWESSKEWYKDEHEKNLKLSEADAAQSLFNFKAKYMREPTKEELQKLTHREPNAQEIKQAMRALWGSIARRGKNHCIQGSNASIIKRAMGSGFDAQGVPYLWHTLPKYLAKLLSMIHDELLIQCPKRKAEEVARLVADAFARAAAEVMSKVKMEAEWNIDVRWKK
jgi:DNA polymerase I-like protein with 3'-5' exonuclease and polymerase domains